MLRRLRHPIRVAWMCASWTPSSCYIPSAHLTQCSPCAGLQLAGGLSVQRSGVQGRHEVLGPTHPSCARSILSFGETLSGAAVKAQCMHSCLSTFSFSSFRRLSFVLGDVEQSQKTEVTCM